MDPRRGSALFQRAHQHDDSHRGGRRVGACDGDQSFKAGEKDDLADEMADVLWVLVCLANQTGVDLTAAVEANFAKKSARDSERHKNNPKLKNKGE